MISMINPGGVPQSPHYSQGAVVFSPRRTLYISGQIGVDAGGRIGEGIAEQALIAVANLNAVLAEAGMDATNLAKVTIYLTDESLISGFMQAASGALPSPPPATTLLVVKALAAPSLLLEIEAVAAG